MSKATKSRALWSSGRGQSLVEFALILPLLLVVAFIITEFGRALWIKNVLTEAAGNAARAAIVSNATDFEADAREAADRMLVPMGMGTTSADPSSFDAEVLTQNGTQVVRVTITRTFSFIPGSAGKGGHQLPTNPGAQGPFINLGDFTITGESVMDTQPSFG
jgi:Flp pilus assembly protein TadG